MLRLQLEQFLHTDTAGEGGGGKSEGGEGREGGREGGEGRGSEGREGRRERVGGGGGRRGRKERQVREISPEINRSLLKRPLQTHMQCRVQEQVRKRSNRKRYTQSGRGIYYNDVLHVQQAGDYVNTRKSGRNYVC